eukprot:m.41648 g.41648  ORF g.41648 m.41648 type:complete len:629 (+) comp9794_c0_seq1:235-2121(+)
MTNQDVSTQGVLTLVSVVVIGPLLWGLYTCFQHVFRKQLDSKTKTAGKNDLKPPSSPELKSFDYLLSLLGYAIGIGNVWRFPYIIATNGGGPAVIAYMCCAVFVSFPLYMMELIVGQHTRLSTINSFRMLRPRWESLAYAQSLICFIVASYFQILLAYTLIYLLNSCYDPLPWADTASTNYSLSTNATLETLRGNAEIFWNDKVLHKPIDPPEGSVSPGMLQWDLCFALFLVWSICFFAIAFGRDVLSKVTYVTVFGPIVLMLILVIRTATLDGAGNGVEFYIGKFDSSAFADFSMWATACSQTIFSLSPGFGTAVTMSSMISPKEDVFRVCVIVAVANSLFSIVGGFAVFATIGNIAYNTNRTVDEVASESGTGLAFIVLAEGITYFGEYANLMSVLFFTMLLTLGLDSSFAWTETCVRVFEDLLHSYHIHMPTWSAVGCVCVSMFLVGLPFCTQYGNDLLNVVDHFVGTIALLLACALEITMLDLDFGFSRLTTALQHATFGNRSTPKGRNLYPRQYWKICMILTIPIATLGLSLYLIIQDLISRYDDMPTNFLAGGWALLGFIMLLSLLTLYKKDAGCLPSQGERDTKAEEKPKKDLRGLELANKEMEEELTHRNYQGKIITTFV